MKPEHQVLGTQTNPAHQNHRFGSIAAFEMKLRILIADDEPLCRERIRQLLQAEAMTEIVTECATGQETLKAIEEKTPDVVFLDIKMPGMDGFDVLKGLNGSHLPVIIFVTAFDQFALQAFDVNAADYLLKPFDRQRFQIALQRARERLQRQPGEPGNGTLSELRATLKTLPKYPERLPIKSRGRISFVDISDIDWIRAADNYVELHVRGATHLLRSRVTALANRLPQNQFVRISRSTLVNFARIKQLHPKSHGDYLVFLHDGTCLTGSRTFRHNLARLLGDSS